MAEEFKVEGLAALQTWMQDLPLKVEKNLLRGMIRAASKPVVDRARALAPVLKDADPRRSPGALKRSIRAMSTIVKGEWVRGGVAAGSRNKKLGKEDAYYAHMVEYGTVKDSAQPFLRPAVATETSATIDAAVAYLRKRIDAGDLK